MAEFIFDSVRPTGAHGDEPAPRVSIGADDRGTVAIRIFTTGQHEIESQLVEVDSSALLQALMAIMRQDERVFAKDAEFQQHHRRTCRECYPKPSEGE